RVGPWPGSSRQRVDSRCRRGRPLAFHSAQTADQVRELLNSREFVLQNPQAVVRLLDRAAQAGTKGLEQVLGELEGLRFRFWNPGLVRIAHKARGLRER